MRYEINFISHNFIIFLILIFCKGGHNYAYVYKILGGGQKQLASLYINKDGSSKALNNIYANILTIMGLFVSVFSLVMVNFTNICDGKLTKEFIIPMNLSLGIVICLFIGLILIFINKATSKGFLIFYGLFMLALLSGLIFII